MWREILSMEDEQARGRLLSAIAGRLGRQYRAQVGTDDSFEDRMRKLSRMLAERQIETEVSDDSGLPGSRHRCLFLIHR